jgi:hypothetical protein
MSFSFSGRSGSSNRSVPFPNPFRPGPRGTRTRLGYIVFGVLWLILFNFLLSFTAAQAKAMTASTTGTVVAQSVSYGHSSSTRHNSGSTSATCTLTVRFQVAGRTYQTPAATGTSGDCNYGPGQSAAISYNPSNPSSYMLTADKGGYGVIRFVMPAIGVLLIVVGVLGFLLQLAAVSAGLALLVNRRSR